VSFPSYYEFACQTKVFAGGAVLEQMPAVFCNLRIENPLFLTDKGVIEAGLLKIVREALFAKSGATGRELTIFDDIPADSDLSVVKKIAQIHEAQRCDAIVAIGGGSVLDTAKGVNLLVSEHAEDLLTLKGAGKIRCRLQPLIAVPTTSGTGSEVTAAAVIKDKENFAKCLFTSVFLQPDVAFLDSRMTLTLPSAITAATAMDALTHAMESYYCLQKNPLSDSCALLAVRLISQNLLKVMGNPQDEAARLSLAIASCLAGMAFSNAMVGMVHTLGHAFGALYGIPHGVCMAILLPYGLEYNMHKSHHLISQLLLPLGGFEEYQKTPLAEHGERVVRAVRDLNAALNKATNGKHPLCFKDIRDRGGHSLVKQEGLSKVARLAQNDGSIFMNPEELDFDDLLMVATSAFEGVPLALDRIKKG